jgi:hypothetical protein
MTMLRLAMVACSLAIVVLCGCSKDDGSQSRGAGGPAGVQSEQQGAVPARARDENSERPPWSLLGAKLDDAEVASFVSSCSAAPIREEFPDYGTFLKLYADGVELSADTSGTVMTVIVYAPGSEKYTAYSGPMPWSLNWDMRRTDVEAILGAPAAQSFGHNSKAERDELWADYPALGVYLIYAAESESDGQAKLLDIRRKLPQQ